MRKRYIIWMILIGIIFFACENNDKTKIGGEIIAPTLDELTSQDVIIDENTNLEKELTVWTWQAADYGFPAAINYMVQADIDTSFENPKEIGISKTTSFSITADILNKIAANFTTQSEPIQLLIRIKTIVTSNEFESAAPMTYSNVREFNFTPYIVEVPVKEAIYITGNLVTGVSEWANSAEDIGKGLQVFFADDSKKGNANYTYSGKFKANSEFKLPTMAGDWDFTWGNGGAGKLILTNNSSNIKGPETDGFYTLDIDLNERTYSFTPLQVTTSYSTISVLGNATTTGWTNETLMTEVSPHNWVLNEISLSVGEIKFRANQTWDVNWGVEENVDIPFGKGQAGSQENIKIEEAGTYFLAFNDITSHYIIIKKDRLPIK